MLAILTVPEYMTVNPISFTPDTDVFAAIRQLLTQKITGAPVLDSRGKMLGFFQKPIA